MFDSTGDPARAYTPELTAMAIFLNRTGFNGLFRLNSKREFNVPEGRYTNPQICDSENLRRVAQALNAAKVSLIHGCFDSIDGLAKPGDFLYFDPPYAPVSKTARFTRTRRNRSAAPSRRASTPFCSSFRPRALPPVEQLAAPEIQHLYGSAAARKARLRVHMVHLTPST